MFAVRAAHPTSEFRPKSIARLHGRLMLVKPIDSPMYQPAPTPILSDFNKMVRPTLHKSANRVSPFEVPSSRDQQEQRTHQPHTVLICHSVCHLFSPSRSLNSNHLAMVNETNCGSDTDAANLRKVAQPIRRYAERYMAKKDGDLWTPLAMCIAMQKNCKGVKIKCPNIFIHTMCF